MSTDTNTIEFNVIVTLDDNSVPQFNYTHDNQPATGDVIVSQESYILYNLFDETHKGLKFTGAAFVTPFDNVINAVSVNEAGNQITLQDLDTKNGKTGFRFVLTNAENTLLVISPDPQVIDRERPRATA